MQREAFVCLKIRLKVFRRKCKSNKIFKIMVLACVVLHNICIESGDLIPSKLHLISDKVTNKTRNSNDVRDLLDPINAGSKNYLLQPWS